MATIETRNQPTPHDNTTLWTLLAVLAFAILAYAAYAAYQHLTYDTPTSVTRTSTVLPYNRTSEPVATPSTNPSTNPN